MIILLVVGMIFFLIAIPPLAIKWNAIAIGLFCWILAVLIEHVAGHVALR